MSVYSYVKENINKVGSNVLITPDINEKKLNNAISAIATNALPKNILAIVDTTIFNSAKEGMVITGDTLYYRGSFASPQLIKLLDLKKAKYSVETIKKDNGKTEIKEELVIYKTDDSTFTSITSMVSVKLEELELFINGLIEEGSKEGFSENVQNLPLADLNEEVKISYLKILCNFALSDDGIIDPSEYAEIMFLLVRIGLNSTNRILLRSYMTANDIEVDNETLFKLLREQTPEASYDILCMSLVKDLIYLLHVKNKEKSFMQNDYIKSICKLLNVSVEQAEAIEQSIKNDEEILKKRKSDTEIQKQLKDLVAKAGAVGVPIAAIYFSGSVVGLSAAGVTSGLASLGMGGVLGFSGMVSGIGIAILLGVGAYSGIKKITGVSELENNKQREVMLQQIIRNSQKALNYLIEDVNLICVQLSDEIRNGKEATLKISKLSAILTTMMNATSSINNKTGKAHCESFRTRLPNLLDIGRLKELTTDATKKKVYEFILNFYQEEEKDGKKVVRIIEDISESDLEALVSAFEGINYFKIADASVAKLKSFVKGFMSKDDE